MLLIKYTCIAPERITRSTKSRNVKADHIAMLLSSVLNKRKTEVGRATSIGETRMSKRITASNIRLKRAYEQPTRDDGARILIDRLWPRGVKRADAAVDQWVKDLAPSTALRK
jgi:hypothetical protein